MDIDPTFGVLGTSYLVIALFFCLVALAVAIVQIIAQWKVAVKLGQPGWGTLIPFYGSWVIARPVAGEQLATALVACQVAGTVFSCSGKLLGLAACMNLAAFVLGVIVSHRLAMSFGRGTGFTVGLVLVPVIFMSVLGFSDDMPHLVAESETDEDEKEDEDD